jgi:hypothetical protein
VVAILLSPFLEFSDVSPTATPSLWSLAEGGAVGSMNAITADPGWPTAAGGALSLSAGRWAAAAATGPANAKSISLQQAANNSSLDRPVLGALGDALHAAGVRTIAVGSSDLGTAGVPALRPAELLATDTLGRVDMTEAGALVADARAPMGVRADRAALSSAITSALADLTSAPGAGGLLVVDPGDLTRSHAEASRPDADASHVATGRRVAIASLDAAAADLASQLPPGSLLLVVTPATDKPYYEPPRFGPVIASGRGLSGFLTSASTHRLGLVTNADVAPTTLAALGIATPSEMIGKTFSATADTSSPAERLGLLAKTETAVGAVDKLRDRYFTLAFAWASVLVIGLAVLAAFRPSRRMSVTAGVSLIAILSVAPAAWIALLVARYPASTAAAAAAFAVAWLMTVGAALMAAKLVRVEALLAVIAAVTVSLIMLDQWFGQPLQTGLFSYSVRGGWRYYGIGNEGSALAVGAALAAIGLSVDLAARTRWATVLRRYGIPVIGGIVLITAAAPFAGANAGVAVWGFAAFAVAWLRINRIPISPRTIAWTTAAVIALVALLAAIDLLGIGGGTHIGRFLVQATQGGPGVWELVRRKALNNVGYLTQTPYSWLALAMMLALLVERFARPRPLATALDRHPGYAAVLAGVIVGSVFALLTEDSGVVMPALMLLSGAGQALYLSLEAPPGSREPFAASPAENSSGKALDPDVT